MSPTNDTQERILESARNLIYTRSYADVGVAEICAEAKVKKGSFYHFFPSKRELTLKVLEATFADIKHDLIDDAFKPDVSPMKRLQRFVDLNIQFQKQMHSEIGVVPGCQFGNLAAEQATQDDVLRGRLDDIFHRIEKELSATLAQAKEAGEIGDADTEATAAAMLAYLEGVILLAKTRNDPAVLNSLLPAMVDVRIPAADSPADKPAV